MAKDNKVQIFFDDETYEIIQKLKPKTMKLFVSAAIEKFAKCEESKLFFKKDDSKEEINNEIPKKIVEVKKTSTIEEWE